MHKITRKDSSPTRFHEKRKVPVMTSGGSSQQRTCPPFSLPSGKNKDMSVSTTASTNPPLSLQTGDQRQPPSRSEDYVRVTLPVEDSQEITLSGDPSKWEAMEVRYIDNEGNSPNISFRIDSTRDGQYNDHSLRHIDKQGLRRQTVTVEKVVISNLLDSSREVCGLPGTSRLSEYKPRDNAMGSSCRPQNTTRIDRLTERSTTNCHQQPVESDSKLICSSKISPKQDLSRQSVRSKNNPPKRKLSTLSKNEVDEYRKIALQILMERKKSKEKKSESVSNDTQCPEISFSDESSESDVDVFGGKQPGILVNHQMSSPPKVKRGKSVSLERKNFEMLSKVKEQILKHRERMEKAKQSPAKPATLPLPPTKFKTKHSNVKAKVVHHNSTPSTTKKESPTRSQRNKFDLWPREAPVDTSLKSHRSADPCVYDASHSETQHGISDSIFTNTPLGDERCLLRMIQSHGIKHPHQSDKQLINSILRSPTAKAVQALYWFYQQTDNRELLKNQLVDESNVSVQDILEAYQKLFLGTNYPANSLEQGNSFDTSLHSCKQLKEKCNDQFLRKTHQKIERNVSLSPPRYNDIKKPTKSVLPPWDNTLHHPDRKPNKSQREIPDYSFSVSESSGVKMLSASSQRTVSSRYISPLQCLKSTKPETEEDMLTSVNPHVPIRQRAVDDAKDNANFPVTSYSNIHIKRLKKCPDAISETANNPFYPPVCEKPRKTVKRNIQHPFDMRTSPPTIKRHIQPFACKQVNPRNRMTSAPVVMKRSNSSVKEKISPIRYSIIEHKKSPTGHVEAGKQLKQIENPLQTQHSPRVYVVESKKTRSPVRTETTSSPPLYTIIGKQTYHHTVLSGAEAEKKKSSPITENEKKAQRQQLEQRKKMKIAGEGESRIDVSINHNFNEPANRSQKKSFTKINALHSNTKETVAQSPAFKWKTHVAHSDTDIIRDNVSEKGSSGYAQTCVKTQTSVSASDFHPNATKNWKRQNVPVKCVRKTIRNERAMNLKDRAVSKSRRALSESDRWDKKKCHDLSAEPSPDDVTLEIPASPISLSVSRLDSQNDFSNIKEYCMESVKSRIPSERKLQKMCFSDHSFHIVNNPVPLKKQSLGQNSKLQKSENGKENQVTEKESSGRLAMSTSHLDNVCPKSNPNTDGRYQSCKNEEFKSPTAKPPESPTLQPTTDAGQMRNQKKIQEHGSLVGKGLLSSSESTSSMNYWTQPGGAVREVRVSLREDQSRSKEDMRIHLGVNRKSSNLDGCNKTIYAPCDSDPTATSKHTPDSTQSQTIIDKMGNMVTVDRAHNEQILQSIKKETEMSNDSTYVSSKLFSNRDDFHLSAKDGNEECHMDAIISTRLKSSDSFSCKTRFIESKSDQMLSISFNDIKELNTLLGDQEDLYWTSPDELRKAIDCASKRARRRSLSQKSPRALSECDYRRNGRGEKEITVSLGVENLTKAEETPGYVHTGKPIPTSACVVNDEDIRPESCPAPTHTHSEHAVSNIIQDQSKIVSDPNRSLILDDVSADTKTITNKYEAQSNTKESSDSKSNNPCDEESKDFTTTSLNSKCTLKNMEGYEDEAQKYPKGTKMLPKPDGIKPLPVLVDRLKIGADCTSDSGDDRDKSETVSSTNFRERTVRNVVKYFSNVCPNPTQDDIKVNHNLPKKCQSSIKEDLSNNPIQEKSELILKEQSTRTNVNDSLLAKQTNNENGSLDSSHEHTLAENDTSLSGLDSTSFVNERVTKNSTEVTDGRGTPKDNYSNKPPKHNSPKTILTNTAKDSKEDNASQKRDPDRTMDSIEGHILEKRIRSIMTSAFGEQNSKSIFQREADVSVDGITKGRSPLPVMMAMNNLHPNFMQHRDYSEGAACYLVMSPPKSLNIPNVTASKIDCESERSHNSFEFLNQPQKPTEYDCNHPMDECYANVPYSFSSAKRKPDSAHSQHKRTGVLGEHSNEGSIEQCRTKTRDMIIEHCDYKVVGANSNVNIPSDETTEMPQVDLQVNETSVKRGGEGSRPIVDSDDTLDIESPIAFHRRWLREEHHRVSDIDKPSIFFDISQNEDCIGKESTFKKNVQTNGIHESVKCDARDVGHVEHYKDFARNECKNKANIPQLIAKEELFRNDITHVSEIKIDSNCDSSYVPIIHGTENVDGFKSTKIVADQHDKEYTCDVGNRFDTSEWRDKFFDNYKERTSYDHHQEYSQAVGCIDVSGEDVFGADIVPPPLEFRTPCVRNSLRIENVDDRDFNKIFFDNSDMIKASMLNDNSTGLALSSLKTHELCQPEGNHSRVQAGKCEDFGRLNKTNDALVEIVGKSDGCSTLDNRSESNAKWIKSCVKHEANNNDFDCDCTGRRDGNCAGDSKNDAIVSYVHADKCGSENEAVLYESSEKMAGYPTNTQTEHRHENTIDKRLLIQRGLEFPKNKPTKSPIEKGEASKKTRSLDRLEETVGALAEGENNSTVRKIVAVIEKGDSDNPIGTLSNSRRDGAGEEVVDGSPEKVDANLEKSEVVRKIVAKFEKGNRAIDCDVHVMTENHSCNTRDCEKVKTNVHIASTTFENRTDNSATTTNLGQSDLLTIRTSHNVKNGEDQNVELFKKVGELMNVNKDTYNMDSIKGKVVGDSSEVRDSSRKHIPKIDAYVQTSVSGDEIDGNCIMPRVGMGVQSDSWVRTGCNAYDIHNQIGRGYQGMLFEAGNGQAAIGGTVPSSARSSSLTGLIPRSDEHNQRLGQASKKDPPFDNDQTDGMRTAHVEAVPVASVQGNSGVRDQTCQNPMIECVHKVFERAEEQNEFDPFYRQNSCSSASGNGAVVKPVGAYPHTYRNVNSISMSYTQKRANHPISNATNRLSQARTNVLHHSSKINGMQSPSEFHSYASSETHTHEFKRYSWEDCITSHQFDTDETQELVRNGKPHRCSFASTSHQFDSYATSKSAGDDNAMDTAQFDTDCELDVLDATFSLSIWNSGRKEQKYKRTEHSKEYLTKEKRQYDSSNTKSNDEFSFAQIPKYAFQGTSSMNVKWSPKQYNMDAEERNTKSIADDTVAVFLKVFSHRFMASLVGHPRMKEQGDTGGMENKDGSMETPNCSCCGDQEPQIGIGVPNMVIYDDVQNYRMPPLRVTSQNVLKASEVDKGSPESVVVETIDLVKESHPHCVDDCDGKACDVSDPPLRPEDGNGTSMKRTKEPCRGASSPARGLDKGSSLSKNSQGGVQSSRSDTSGTISNKDKERPSVLFEHILNTMAFDIQCYFDHLKKVAVACQSPQIRPWCTREPLYFRHESPPAQKTTRRGQIKDDPSHTPKNEEYVFAPGPSEFIGCECDLRPTKEEPPSSSSSSLYLVSGQRKKERKLSSYDITKPRPYPVPAAQFPFPSGHVLISSANPFLIEKSVNYSSGPICNIPGMLIPAPHVFCGDLIWNGGNVTRQVTREGMARTIKEKTFSENTSCTRKHNTVREHELDTFNDLRSFTTEMQTSSSLSDSESLTSTEYVNRYGESLTDLETDSSKSCDDYEMKRKSRKRSTIKRRASSTDRQGSTSYSRRHKPRDGISCSSSVTPTEQFPGCRRIPCKSSIRHKKHISCKKLISVCKDEIDQADIQQKVKSIISMSLLKFMTDVLLIARGSRDVMESEITGKTPKLVEYTSRSSQENNPSRNKRNSFNTLRDTHVDHVTPLPKAVSDENITSFQHNNLYEKSPVKPKLNVNIEHAVNADTKTNKNVSKWSSHDCITNAMKRESGHTQNTTSANGGKRDGSSCGQADQTDANRFWNIRRPVSLLLTPNPEGVPAEALCCDRAQANESRDEHDTGNVANGCGSLDGSRIMEHCRLEVAKKDEFFHCGHCYGYENERELPPNLNKTGNDGSPNIPYSLTPYIDLKDDPTLAPKEAKHSSHFGQLLRSVGFRERYDGHDFQGGDNPKSVGTARVFEKPCENVGPLTSIMKIGTIYPSSPKNLPKRYSPCGRYSKKKAPLIENAPRGKEKSVDMNRARRSTFGLKKHASGGCIGATEDVFDSHITRLSEIRSDMHAKFEDVFECKNVSKSLPPKINTSNQDVNTRNGNKKALSVIIGQNRTPIKDLICRYDNHHFESSCNNARTNEKGSVGSDTKPQGTGLKKESQGEARNISTLSSFLDNIHSEDGWNKCWSVGAVGWASKKTQQNNLEEQTPPGVQSRHRKASGMPARPSVSEDSVLKSKSQDEDRSQSNIGDKSDAADHGLMAAIKGNAWREFKSRDIVIDPLQPCDIDRAYAESEIVTRFPEMNTAQSTSVPGIGNNEALSVLQRRRSLVENVQRDTRASLLSDVRAVVEPDKPKMSLREKIGETKEMQISCIGRGDQNNSDSETIATKRLNQKCETEYTGEEKAIRGTKTEIEGFPGGGNKEWTRSLEKKQISVYSKSGDEKDLSPTNDLNGEGRDYRQKDTSDSPQKNRTFQEDCAILGEKERRLNAPNMGALMMGGGVDRKGRQSAERFGVAENIIPSSILTSHLNNPLNSPNIKTYYVSGNNRDYNDNPYESLYIDDIDSAPVLNIRERMAKLYGDSSKSDKLKNTYECAMDGETRHRIDIRDNLFQNGQTGHLMSRLPGNDNIQYPEKSCKEQLEGELMKVQTDSRVQEDNFSSINMSGHPGNSCLISPRGGDDVIVTDKQTSKTPSFGTIKPSLESCGDNQLKGVSSSEQSNPVTSCHAAKKDVESQQKTELHTNTQNIGCQATFASSEPQIQNPMERQDRNIPSITSSTLQVHGPKETTQGSSIHITHTSTTQQPVHLRSVGLPTRASFSTGVNDQPLNLGLNKEYATATPRHLVRRDILNYQNASGYSEDENANEIEYFQTKPLPSCSLDSELQHAIETMSSTSRFKRNECKHTRNTPVFGSSEQKAIPRHTTVHPSDSPSTFGYNSDATPPRDALKNRRADHDEIPKSELRILNCDEMSGPLPVDNTCPVVTTQRTIQDHDNDTPFPTHGEGVVKNMGMSRPENIKQRFIETKHPFFSPASITSIPCNENKVKWSRSDPQFLSPIQMNDSQMMRIETLQLGCMGNILSPHLQGSDSEHDKVPRPGKGMSSSVLQNSIQTNSHGHRKDATLDVLTKEKSKGSKEDTIFAQLKNNTTSFIPVDKKGRLLNSKSFCHRKENNISSAALTKNICQVTPCAKMPSCPRFPLEGSLANSCEQNRQVVNASQRQMNGRQELGSNDTLTKRLCPGYSGLTRTAEGRAVPWDNDKRLETRLSSRGALPSHNNHDWKGSAPCSEYTSEQVMSRDRSPLRRSKTDLTLETGQSSLSSAKCARREQTPDKDVDLMSSMADSKMSHRSSKSYRVKRKKSHVLFPVEIKSGSPHQIVEDFKKSKVKPSQIPIDVYKLYPRGKGPFSPKVRTLTISGPLMNMNIPVFRHGVEEVNITDVTGDLKPPPGYECDDLGNEKSDLQLEHECTLGEGPSTGYENKPRWRGVMKKFVPFGKKKM